MDEYLKPLSDHHSYPFRGTRGGGRGDDKFLSFPIWVMAGTSLTRPDFTEDWRKDEKGRNVREI